MGLGSVLMFAVTDLSVVRAMCEGLGPDGHKDGCISVSGDVIVAEHDSCKLSIFSSDGALFKHELRKFWHW